MFLYGSADFYAGPLEFEDMLKAYNEEMIEEFKIYILFVSSPDRLVNC